MPDQLPTTGADRKLRRRRSSEGYIATGKWWALVRRARSLPVLFDTYEGAAENREEDEYIVQVLVSAANPRYRAPKWTRGRKRHAL